MHHGQRPGRRRSILTSAGILLVAWLVAAPFSSHASSSSIDRLLDDADGDGVPDMRGRSFTITSVAVSDAFSVVASGVYFSRAYVAEGESGIMLQSPDEALYLWVKAGDELVITGTLDFYNGSPILVPSTVEKTGTRPIPAPVPVSIADLNSDMYEGRLIIATGQLTNAQNIELVDGDAAIRVRARTALREDPQFIEKYRSGRRARIVGIASQYDATEPFNQGYRIELLSTTDSIQLLPDYRRAAQVTAVAAVILFFAFVALLARRRAARYRQLLLEVRASRRALQESEEKLQLVARATSDLMWELFIDDNLLVRGAGSDELFLEPVESTDLNGDDLFSSVHPEDAERILESFSRALDSDSELWMDEYRVIRVDGSVLHLRDHAIIQRDEDNKPTHVVGALQDITAATEEKRRQEAINAKMRQSQKIESLGVLAGGIAHDFNNILAVIIGQAEVLQRNGMDHGEQRMRAREIVKAAMRGSNLSKRMLAYAGKAPVESDELSINRLTRDIHAMLSEVAPKNVNLVNELDDELPLVIGDEGQLQQVVMNLVMNAIESIGDETGQVRASTEFRKLEPNEFLQVVSGQFPDDDKPYVVLTVEDDGCGMDLETQSRIFEPFFSSKGASRGMGLSAVVGIINTHNGYLLVNSAAGKGSVFKMLLSPVLEDSGSIAIPKSTETDRTARFDGTVLVADDEAGLVDFETNVLEALGATVIPASNGEQALNQFRKRADELDLVVLDVSMPKMSGVEVYKLIRESRPDLPVLLFSGLGSYEVESRLVADKHLAVLSKPVSLEKFRHAVLTLVSAEA